MEYLTDQNMEKQSAGKIAEFQNAISKYGLSNEEVMQLINVMPR